VRFPTRLLYSVLMGKLFGTDGIRAVAGEYPLDPSTIFKLGLALVRLGMKRVVIGRDTRASGVWIQRVLERAILAEGGEVDLVGVITTPGVSFLSSSQPFDAGIMISASHNPYQDNGIKVFSHEGIKLTDASENRVEEMLDQDQASYTFPPDTFGGWEAELTDFEEAQVDSYARFLPRTAGATSLEGLKVVLDCANGAAFHIAPRVFKELGANVEAINVQPEGHNINEACGALYPSEIRRLTVKLQADLGVAFDGDSDRAIFSDEQGNLIDGDHVLLVLARYLKRQGQMPSDSVVTTIMANLGLELALREEGLNMIRTKVGDRYVLEEMLRGNHPLGGEQSGHVIIREQAVAGDGILTALNIARIIKEEGKGLGALSGPLRKLPQILLNLPVRERKDFSSINSITSEIRAVEEGLKDRGRIIVRYSGTEPLVRIMVEGEKQEEIAAYAEAIAARFREELG
jgi:phosphoglucosamine mutase